MVLKTHAGDLDLFDRRLPRRHSRLRVAFANQLPANPAGETQLPESEFWSALAVALRRQRFGFSAYANPPSFFEYEQKSKAPSSLRYGRRTLRKKINVKRVNC